MKKLMFGIAGVITIIVSANAVDTDQIKSACMSSDKTIWVESNKVCIPKNPCKDPKFEQYCNSAFKDMYANEYADQEKDFVNLFAVTRGMDCKAQDVEYDYNVAEENIVICKGQDVSVFEFASIIIKDRTVSELDENTLYALTSSVCTKVLDGEYLAKDDDGYKCVGANVNFCKKASGMNYSYPISISQRWSLIQTGSNCYFTFR